MRRPAAAIALLAVAPFTLAGAAQASAECKVWSGGGWLSGPCPTATTAPVAPVPVPGPPVSVSVERLAGANKYATAAAISAAHFAPGVPAVYLANGNGIDALAAGPAVDGPILTMPATGKLPVATATELARLNPHRVVVLGGPLALSDSMVGQAVAAANR